MKITIEKICEKEAYEYAELKIQIWKTCYEHILPETYLNEISISKKALKYQNEMKNDSWISYYFVIVSDKPVGVLRLECYQGSAKENCICIKDLYLLQQYQNKGYGGSIFKFIVKQANINKCRYITAWILEKNEVASALALKIGFKKTSHIATHDKTRVILSEYCLDLYNRPELLIC